MKTFYAFLVIFLLTGMASVAAQDLIVLRTGVIIEAKVTEISQAEIRYRQFNHLDGPVIVLPRANVLVIRYENGTSQIINSQPAAGQANTQAQAQRPYGTALDPDKFIFAFNINPVGALLYGPSVCLELGKGRFNTEINLFFPGLSIGFDGGFGGLVTFNGFRHTRNGGAYLGGGFGIIFAYNGREGGRPWGEQQFYDHFETLGIFGLNAGYKFVTRSGVYFRTGGFLGFATSSKRTKGEAEEPDVTSFYFKPDLTLGYSF